MTFHYSNCCILRVKTITARQTVANLHETKSSQTKLHTAFPYKNNPSNFSSMHVRICVKGATNLQKTYVYVVVNFFISGNFCFSFVFGYANEVETKEK